MAKTGLLTIPNDPYAQRDPYQTMMQPYARTPSSQSPSPQGAFRGGLQTEFHDQGPPTSYDYMTKKFNSYAQVDPSSAGDRDVEGAANAYNQMYHGDRGTNHAEQEALYNMYRGRIGIKNSLAEQIDSLPSQLAQQEGILKLGAGQALGEGLRKTRENYNSRGLLYSGLREGGEQKKRQQVAGALSSGLMGAKRESANSMSAAENAYASVDLQNQQESLALAHQAFDTANSNNIARLQAMQQLGQGVGKAAGDLAGAYDERHKNDNAKGA